MWFIHILKRFFMSWMQIVHFNFDWKIKAQNFSISDFMMRC